jgi:hypothetical protein
MRAATRLNKILLIACACAASLLIAACGGGGGAGADEQGVKQSMQRFLGAIGAGNGAAACQLVTPAGQQALAQQIATLTHSSKQVSCEVIITQIAKLLPADIKTGLQNARVQKVTIKRGTATVRGTDIKSSKGNLSTFVNAQQPTKLQKVGAVWKVTS